MKTTTDIGALKVCCGDDAVWYLDRAGLPQSSQMGIQEFVRSDILRQAECVRVIGSPTNADLIVALFDRKVRGQLASVAVATPLVCHTARERCDPATVLFRMRRFFRAPSQGGFHEVVEHDYTAYALSRELQRNGHVTAQARRLLRRHPAWKPLTFIPTLDADSCAELLALVIDPRFFVDICRPDRTAKLEGYLGLNPRTQAAVTYGMAKHPHNYERCKLVLNCWKRAELEMQIGELYDLVGPRVIAGADRPGVRPGDFLWRRWGYISGRGPDSRQPAKSASAADLAASKRFIQFLRAAWLQELYREAAMPDCGQLFDAKYFFRQDIVVAQEYDHYMQDQR